MLLGILYVLALICILMKLGSLLKKEDFKMPSEMIEEAERGEDLEKIANEACETSDREKIALEQSDTTQGGWVVDPDIQAEEIENAEKEFYGMAKHALSGNLLRVNGVNGLNITDEDGWVKRTSDGGKYAISKEDVESADDAFSRNYALWKCSKLPDCKGTIYARDGSKFALFKDFGNGSMITKTDPGIKVGGSQTGRGEFITNYNGVTTNQNLVESTDEDAMGQYDVHVRESPGRIAAEKIAANMKEGQTANWQTNYGDALDGAIISCGQENPGLDSNTFKCVVTGCKKRNKDGEKQHKCKASPRTLL